MNLVNENSKKITVERVCFCCGNRVEEALRGERGFDVDSPPADATVWQSGGNYGSGVYDPDSMDQNKYLMIYICDGCLRERRERVFHIGVRVKEEYVVMPFNE